MKFARERSAPSKTAWRTSAQVSGESFSGRLKATGVTIEKRRGPGSSFSTRYGSGSGRVTVETFSGSAEVRVE